MSRLRRLDLLATAGSVVMVVIALVIAFGSGDDTAKLRIYWSAIPVVDLYLFRGAVYLARRPGIDPRERRLWRALTFQMMLIFVGDLAQGVKVWVTTAPDAIVTNAFTQACNSVSMLPLVLVLVTFRVRESTPSMRLRYVLDAGSMAVATGVVNWFTSKTTAAETASNVTWVLGSVILSVMTFGALKLVLAGVLQIRQIPGTLVGSGALLQILTLGTLAPGRPVALPLAGLALSGGMIAIGMRVHRRNVVNLDFNARPRRPYSLLPYTALLLTFSFIPATVRHGVGADFWVVTGGLFAVTAMVVCRQILAFLENSVLLERLDASLTEARDLHEQLRHQATHDGLTGLANRALFDERLDRPAGPLAVLLVDLDGFKMINDVHGHHAGDAILTAVAERLRRSVPITATTARLGGDEFAVLLPDLDVVAAERIADHFMEVLQEPVVVDGTVLRARASVGVAAGVDEPAADLVRRADQAMYERKRASKATRSSAGREQVLVS